MTVVKDGINFTLSNSQEKLNRLIHCIVVHHDMYMT